jgi:hypothetical protein
MEESFELELAFIILRKYHSTGMTIVCFKLKKNPKKLKKNPKSSKIIFENV